MANELETLYRWYEEGGGGSAYDDEYPLPEMKIQYKDYAAWQCRHLQSEASKKQLEYWKNTLTGYETLNLETDRERLLKVSYEGDDVSFWFDKKTSALLRNAAQELGVSLYTVLLSGYYLLLSAYSGQKDIIVGTVIANRDYEEISGMIGFFANTLAMRQKVDTDDDIFEFIKRVGESAQTAQLNQDIPFDMLVDELEIEKDSSRHPVFQAAFSLQTVSSRLKNESALFAYNEKEKEIFDNKIAKFDLSLEMADDGEEINGNLNYATSLFERDTIKSYIETYQEIISQIAMAGEINEVKS
jgi:hypothetical protein